MTCQAISVGGGHWTVCTLPAGHPRSHLDRNPWQPITQETPMPFTKHNLSPDPEIMRDGSIIVPKSRKEADDAGWPRPTPTLPVPNRPQETSLVLQAATRCLRTAEDLKAADAAVDQAEAQLRQAIDRQEAAAAAAHAAAIDMLRATSAASDRA